MFCWASGPGLPSTFTLINGWYGAVDISVALTKCTQTASSSSLCLEQLGKEQSFNPGFQPASPPLASSEGPVAAGVMPSRGTHSLLEWPQSCLGTSCLSSSGAGATTGTAASPGAAPPARDLPFGIWTPSASPVALEVVSRVHVSIPAWWLLPLGRRRSALGSFLPQPKTAWWQRCGPQLYPAQLQRGGRGQRGARLLARGAQPFDGCQGFRKGGKLSPLAQACAVAQGRSQGVSCDTVWSATG